MPVSSVQEALQALQQGHVDLAVSNHLYGNYHAGEYGVVPTSIVFQPAGSIMRRPREGGELQPRIDYWLHAGVMMRTLPTTA